MIINTAKKGFSVVEALVGAAIISVALAALSAVGAQSVRVSSDASARVRAAYLLEEGAEAARAMRDINWNSFAAYATGTPYRLAFSGSAWSMSQAPALVDGRFDRTVTLYPVFRDPVGHIMTVGGTSDPDSRRVLVRVSWSTRGATTSVEASTILGNIF